MTILLFGHWRNHYLARLCLGPSMQGCSVLYQSALGSPGSPSCTRQKYVKTQRCRVRLGDPGKNRALRPNEISLAIGSNRRAKNMIQDTMGIVPTGFVLEFAASGQDTLEMGTGSHATRDEMATEHDVFGSLALDG
uniref:Uncharacterized protein n=1 Tax=Candidatus Kentrum sp. FW TaxID=2126338 RepID=A0A450U0C7_9GAMM|nr:MAG: hypothetical protein BECKFW1821C_GA0114237_108713 [Candidatus Kentron sp. FW]